MSTATTLESLSRFIWAPTYLETVDGLPLATNIMDFIAFDYRSLTNDPLLKFCLRPEAMLCMVMYYLFSIRSLKETIAVYEPDPKSSTFRAFLVIHNFGLAVFSLVCTWNLWLLWGASLADNGWYTTMCDQDGTLWRTTGLGSWTNVFYLSKFYEFLDTWILIYKRKEPSLLQVYHHAGVVITMWGAVVSQSPWLPLASAINSFIHTLMYTYFCIKTIWPTVEIKAAKYLTSLQIVQFFSGICFSVMYYHYGNDCDTQSSRFTCAVSCFYVTILMGLFLSFANNKYRKKDKSGSKKKDT